MARFKAKALPNEIAAEVQRSLMTTLFSCRAVLPGMVERGAGVVVNVSSAATRGIHRIPYSAAKGGINAITASLALESLAMARGLLFELAVSGDRAAVDAAMARWTHTVRRELEEAAG